MRSALPLLLLALASPHPALAAGAPEAPRVTHAWARPTQGSVGASAIYLDIEGGTRTDSLTGASSPAAAKLEMHRSTMSGGMMTMQPQGAVAVPARGRVRLAPGGLHIMLMGARRPLRAGDSLPVTLTFARAGAVTVQAQVRASPPAR